MQSTTSLVFMATGTSSNELIAECHTILLLPLWPPLSSAQRSTAISMALPANALLRSACSTIATLSPAPFVFLSVAHPPSAIALVPVLSVAWIVHCYDHFQRLGTKMTIGKAQADDLVSDLAGSWTGVPTPSAVVLVPRCYSGVQPFPGPYDRPGGNPPHRTHKGGHRELKSCHR